MQCPDKLVGELTLSHIGSSRIGFLLCPGNGAGMTQEKQTDERHDVKPHIFSPLSGLPSRIM
jgi:hypothetical protein